MSEDTLKKRYLSRIISRVIHALFGLVTVGLVPRSLGPSDFGNFTFLNLFFNRLFQLMDFSVSNAFFTKFSKRQSEKKLLSFRLLFFIISGFIIVLISLFVVKSEYKELILPAQNQIIIYAVLIYTLLNALLLIVRNVNDILGFTSKFELLVIIQTIFFSVSILSSFYLNQLNINSYIIISCLSFLFIIISGTILFIKKSNIILNDLKLTKPDIIRYTKEFFVFVNPLLILSILFFISTYLDRWLIQKFYGSVEQGYFSITEKICGLVFLLTSSFLPLLQRELSVEIKNDNIENIKKLYYTVGQSFFFLTAVFCIFICFNAVYVIKLIGGEEYLQASIILSIFSIFTVYRVKNQFCYIFLLSSEKTILLRNYTAISFLIGIPLAYLLVAPESLYGFGLGILGLSIKLLIIQQLLVIFISIRIDKKLNNPSASIFLNEFFILFTLSIIAISTKAISVSILSNEYMQILLNGISYLTISSIILFFSPRIFGFDPENFKTLSIFIRNRN